MLLERGHAPWIVGCAIALAAATVLFVVAAGDPLTPTSGGSVSGLIFGGAGTACMLFAAALTLRKRLKNWRLGKTSRWMAGHVWLSVLALPLLLFHGGFQFGGPLTTWLLILLLLSWFSGVLGLLAQQLLPRLMTEQVARETVYEQIDHVIGLLREEAKKLVEVVAKPKPGSAPLVEFFSGQAGPWLAAARPAPAAFDRPAIAQMQRSHLKRLVPAELHESVDDLFEICEERRQLERQRRLHLLLHGWLFLHVPVSWALIAGTLFHAVLALRY